MLSRLKETSADQVKNAFFANYLAAMVLLKLQDMQGLHLINDHAGATDLSRFKNSMSDVNFWARVIFYPTNPAVKHRLMFGHAAILDQESGRITSGMMKKIVKLPLQAPDSVNWNETIATLVLLRHRYTVNSTYARNIISYLYRWDNFLSGNLKKRAVNDAFMYLMQSDPKSNLLPRLRALSNGMLLKAVDTIARKITGFKRINEDEGGDATSVGNIATGDLVSNSIITPPQLSYDSNQPSNQYKFDSQSDTKKKKLVIKDGRVIKRKVKGFKPRKYKLPSHLRVKNNPDVKDTTKITFKDVAKDQL